MDKKRYLALLAYETYLQEGPIWLVRPPGYPIPERIYDEMEWERWWDRLIDLAVEADLPIPEIPPYPRPEE